MVERLASCTSVLALCPGPQREEEPIDIRDYLCHAEVELFSRLSSLMLPVDRVVDEPPSRLSSPMLAAAAGRVSCCRRGRLCGLVSCCTISSSVRTCVWRS